MTRSKPANNVRIIGGCLRGRKIAVTDAEGLRPTSDRVRETLFNWLMQEIAGSYCLDLFAGSGSLGFECLSRGAASVDFVEADRRAADMLRQTWQTLTADVTGEAQILQQDALHYLQQRAQRRYELVFLDPPYAADVLDAVIEHLVKGDWLVRGALIYIEQNAKQLPVSVPGDWEQHRQKRAGQTRYSLYRC